MSTATPPPVANSTLQERLQFLLSSHSQADIARRTETQRMNVTRYLRGTRVPAEFCVALVEGMGVNPAWLLTGEGNPYLADLSGATRSMASDMVQLV